MLEDIFRNLGNEVLQNEARNSPQYSQTVSVRLGIEQLAKVDSLAEMLNTSRQEIFTNLLYGSLDQAILSSLQGLDIKVDDYGMSPYFQKILSEKKQQIESKNLSKKGDK